MSNFRKAWVCSAGVLMALAWSVAGWGAMSSANYSIPNDVIGGGGNTMSSASYSLSSTVGQSSPLGDAASANYNNYPGFWQADETVFDADGDGLTNAREYGEGTNPYAADTDHDGMNDYLEVVTLPCLDPLNEDSDGDGLYDGLSVGNPGEDVNHNGIVDATESNPCDPDTDHDGLDDGQEVLTYHTLAYSWDTDHDRLPDGYEVAHIGDPLGSLDPLNAVDGPLDYDGDHNANQNDYWNRDGHVYETDPAPGQWDNPACYYWGDGDGDGKPAPSDIVMMKLEIVGVPQNYTFIIPHTKDTLDLDRDGNVAPSDLTAMKLMVALADRPGGYDSTPTSLEIESTPGSGIKVGDTTHITLSVHNGYGLIPYSSGIGVVYWVQSGSATLMGGEGTLDGGPAGNRYDFSMDSAGHAQSTIVVRVDAAGPIQINARIPVCGVPTAGRWADEVLLAAPITITGQ
jgi:hypothetical protein